MGLRILELFSGLGGWRQAFEGWGTVVAAYDISPHANATYHATFGDRPWTKELASIPAAVLARHEADTWAMSPPCQPFCRMGHQQGLADPRSKAFLHLLQLLPVLKPEALVLENVQGFLDSEAFGLLRSVLDGAGYHALTYRLCPTDFGWPNQRPRVFVVARRTPLLPRMLPRKPCGPLAPFLDDPQVPQIHDPEALRHRAGLDLVGPQDTRSACFIGGYGQRYVGSGSFLETADGIRRFSPTEVARLLGWGDRLRFPEAIPPTVRYKLLGNGLSIPVARWVAGHLAAQN